MGRSRDRGTVRRLAFAGVLAGALVPWGGTALAETPAQDAYGGIISEQPTPSQLPASITPATTPAPAPPPVSEISPAPTPRQEIKGVHIAPETPAATPQTVPASKLPFTGTDLRWAVLLGVVLLGTGLALRRSIRS